jgi:two-component system, OmpR family, response regulator MprA
MSAVAGSKRVLLVDGDVRTSRRLAELLEQDGYQVNLARDGAEALVQLATETTPDVLVTELRLPIGDGPSVARSARLLSPAVSVVVLTRYANAVSPASFGSPAPLVLPKPLDYDSLLAALRKPAASPGI